MGVHTLLVDSRDRDPSEKENFYTVTLPKVYKEVVGARLLTAEVPCSFYVFTESNTSFSINAQTITIPPGNYGVCDLVKTVNELFIQDNWIVSLCLKTQKVSINVPETETSLVIDGPLAPYLGFGSELPFVSNLRSLTAPNMASTNPHTYLLLDIPELNSVDDIDRVGSCFAKIPCDADTGEYVYVDNSDSVSLSELRPARASLASLRIRWRFRDRSLVDFNGLDHAFSIEIVTKDRSENVPQNKPKAPPPTIVVNPAPVVLPPKSSLPDDDATIKRRNLGILVGGLLAIILAVWFLSTHKRSE